MTLSIVIFLLLWMLGLAGCARSPVASSPLRTNGELLSGTTDVAVAGDVNFSLSPSGRWLVYLSSQGTPFTPLYILYDLKSQFRYEIEFSAAALQLAEQGLGPLNQLACWHSTETQVMLPAGDGLFFVASLDEMASENQQDSRIVWQVIEGEAVERSQQKFECPNGSEAEDIPLTVRQLSSRDVEIVLRSDPTILLAHHQASNLLTSEIRISHLAISPDRQRVSYLVTEYQGSFVLPTQGFRLNLALQEQKQPFLLVAPVYGSLRWAGDSHTLHGVVNDRGSSILGTGIFQWGENTHESSN